MKNTNLQFHNIYIDGERLNIPFAIFNERRRKTILITAGIDGDEYSGIEAANKLIECFKEFESGYRVIVIPLVNVFGNKEGVSFNPRDGKYPKYIYPGKTNGTSSEQLIFNLNYFIKQSFLWIDLHAGSKDERLNPFIWTWQTKNKKINDLTLSLISNFQNDEKIYQKELSKKTEELAKQNIAYLMLESGELGLVRDEYVKNHLDWIGKIIAGSPKRKKIQVYRKIKFYKANRSGNWQPELFPGRISQKKIAGINQDKKIYSEEGLIIYIKKPMLVEKGEELFATAYDMELI